MNARVAYQDGETSACGPWNTTMASANWLGTYIAAPEEIHHQDTKSTKDTKEYNCALRALVFFLVCFVPWW